MVVLPASGWEIMANVRLALTSLTILLSDIVQNLDCACCYAHTEKFAFGRLHRPVQGTAHCNKGRTGVLGTMPDSAWLELRSRRKRLTEKPKRPSVWMAFILT
jgi:hypothetical protein